MPSRPCAQCARMGAAARAMAADLDREAESAAAARRQVRAWRHAAAVLVGELARCGDGRHVPRGVDPSAVDVRAVVGRIESYCVLRISGDRMPDDLPRLPGALREAWLLLRRQGESSAQCVAASLGLRVEAARDRLARLVRAGWASQERDGRRIRYACVREGGSCV